MVSDLPPGGETESPGTMSIRTRTVRGHGGEAGTGWPRTPERSHDEVPAVRLLRRGIRAAGARRARADRRQRRDDPPPAAGARRVGVRRRPARAGHGYGGA